MTFLCFVVLFLHLCTVQADRIILTIAIRYGISSAHTLHHSLTCALSAGRASVPCPVWSRAAYCELRGPWPPLARRPTDWPPATDGGEACNTSVAGGRRLVRVITAPQNAVSATRASPVHSSNERRSWKAHGRGAILLTLRTSRATGQHSRCICDTLFVSAVVSPHVKCTSQGEF